jgi:hypothetical protein
MQQVPSWWLWFSGLFFIFSILWNIALCIAAWQIYKKVMPIVTEAQIQVRRVGNQVRGVAVKASHTAEIVHAQTQRFLGNAETTSTQVTRQARAVGAALTSLIVAARVVNFVRKVI